jgi:hypothetical protein
VPPKSLEIPLLGFSLRALIDRQAFSFCEFLPVPAVAGEARDLACDPASQKPSSLRRRGLIFACVVRAPGRALDTSYSPTEDHFASQQPLLTIRTAQATWDAVRANAWARM